ncbi:MAG TPA: ATP-binding protein [Labilithrix sp.]|nr:ATP-binding protein [Labilithrix sp.]
MLSARLSLAPGTRYFRYSAAASFAATIFCLGNAFLFAGISVSVAVWAARISLAAAGLHQAAWLRFLASWTHRELTRVERVFLVSCLVSAALVLVPGLGTGDEAAPRQLLRLGVTAYEPDLGAAGAISMLTSVVVQIHLVLAALRSRHAYPRARALVVAFVGLLAVGIADGLTVALSLPFPLIGGIGFVSVSVGVGTVIVGAAVETSRTLDAKTSELDRARVALVERERLAGLGELAAVVAHEVRNPLAVVFNALAGLRRFPAHNEDASVLLGIIEQEANRLKRLVATLLDAVRPFELQVAPRELAAIVENAVALATVSAERDGSDVTIHVDIPLHATFVCDDVLLTQALSNLVSNALDAPGRSGPVLVRVSTSDAEAGGVRFEVTDDGEGVAEGDRDRIFSPFFTTRATGTGLGLTLVKRIAEAHRGVAALEVPTERGARFVIELPAPLPSSMPVVPGRGRAPDDRLSK